MHPYEVMFHYLRRVKGSSWKVDNDGVIRHRYKQRLFLAAADVYMFESSCSVQGFLRDLCGMNQKQAAYATGAAEGWDYPGCGYEDLARKLRHYLGAK